MVRFRCGQCGKIYGQDAFMALESREIEGVGTGKEKVCLACGAGMHTDQWRIRNAVGGTSIELSTVSELVALDLGGQFWFSTALIYDNEVILVDRYRTKEESKEGHEIALKRAELGELVEMTEILWASND